MTRLSSQMDATLELMRLCKVRITQHSIGLKNSDALDRVTAIEKLLDHAMRLAKEVPTLENTAEVLRESLHVVRNEKERCQNVGETG